MVYVFVIVIVISVFGMINNYAKYRSLTKSELQDTTAFDKRRRANMVSWYKLKSAIWAMFYLVMLIMFIYWKVEVCKLSCY